MRAAILLTLILTSCATELTPEGENVRLVDSQSDFNCRFITTVTASESMGLDSSDDAQGAMNELRNDAAISGANAIRVINIESTPDNTTAIAEALDCEF